MEEATDDDEEETRKVMLSKEDDVTEGEEREIEVDEEEDEDFDERVLFLVSCDFSSMLSVENTSVPQRSKISIWNLRILTPTGLNVSFIPSLLGVKAEGNVSL